MSVAHSLNGAPGAWDLDPLILALAVTSMALYARGSRLLAARKSLRRPAAGRQVSFHSGIILTTAAVASPLHGWSERLFAAHMVQHLLLVLIAAPLVVIGRPTGPFIAGLPGGAARSVSALIGRLRKRLGMVLHPVTVWAIHALVLWTWHLPSFYDAALRNDLLHGLEHVSFVATALPLWALVLGARPIREGAAVLLLFATGLQSSALGALLTFAGSPLYDTHVRGAPTASVDPLSDQQLAGVIMWIPPGLIYLAISVVLLGRMLQDTRPPLEEVGP